MHLQCTADRPWKVVFALPQYSPPVDAALSFRNGSRRCWNESREREQFKAPDPISGLQRYRNVFLQVDASVVTILCAVTESL